MNAIFIRILAAAFLYGSLPSVADAQTGGNPPSGADAMPFASADTLQERARALSVEGRRQEAVPLLERALALREKADGPKDIQTAYTAFLLAEAYRLLRRYADAEPLFERAVAIYLSHPVGREHQYTAIVLYGFAQLRSTQGRLVEAEKLHRQTLEMRQKVLNARHPEVVASLLDLAVVYSLQGRRAEAAPLFQQAVAVASLAKLLERAEALMVQRRYQEAAALFEHALAARESADGPERPNSGRVIQRLADAYRVLGRPVEADTLYGRALAIFQSAHGRAHADVAAALTGHGLIRGAQNRLAEAEVFHAEALAIREGVLGMEHRWVALSLNHLAEVFLRQRRFAEAEPLFKRSLEIRQKILGARHPDVASSLLDLAAVYSFQDRDAEAEPFYQQALAVAGADLLQERAEALSAQGQYAEAIQLLERALAMREKANGPAHPSTGISAVTLASANREIGRFAEAERHYERAIAIFQRADGRESLRTANVLLGLASLRNDQGRFVEAESLVKEVVNTREKLSGPEHPSVAGPLSTLAYTYRFQGRAAEAVPLAERSVKILERVHGPQHADMVWPLQSLAMTYLSMRRFSDAETRYSQALAIEEKARRPGHPKIAVAQYHLGQAKLEQGRYQEAGQLLNQALDVFKSELGPQAPIVARTFGFMGRIYSQQRRYEEAEPYVRQMLAIREAILGPEHADLAASLNTLAILYRQQGRHSDALALARRASAIRGARARESDDDLSAGGRAEKKAARTHFVSHVQIAHDNFGPDGARNAELTAEAFEVAQLAINSSAAGAVDNMGARFAAGNSALAALIRERQDTVDGWQRADAQRVAAVSRPAEQRDANAEAVLRASLAQADVNIKSLDARLAKEFPEYAELASARPLPLTEAQALLKADEALLTWVTGSERTFLWALRRDRARMWQIELGSKALSDAVAALRKGLSPEGVRTLADLPRFPAEQAYDLYEKLIAPAEPLLAGANHVFVVQEGALASLPLGVLLAEKPGTTVAGFAEYREFPWLAKRYALTTLPSVSSLRALRRFAREAQAKKPFIGIGDPALDGGFGASRSIDVEVSELFTARGLADVTRLKALPALPDTATELRSLAALLGAGEGDLHLRGDATETRVKQLDLAQARVIAFATHGLVAGDLSEVAEPALVLTPPLAASPLDDGLLTASEVAQLKLNADLVILSACNTAAGGGQPGADALSGLARAYFYAGARALLVSHWPVATDAAVRLTTGMLTETGNGDIGRAEALRRSMQSLMSDRSKPHYAHPIFWAPFVVVGEGGRTGG